MNHLRLPELFSRMFVARLLIVSAFILGGIGLDFRAFAQQSPLAITTSELPAATVGQPFSITLQATGGTGTYVWGLPRSEGNPYPSSFQFTSNGVLSGTPTATQVGKYTTRLQVTDSAGVTAVRTFELAVFPAPTQAINAGGGGVGRFLSDRSNGTIEGGSSGNVYSTSNGIDTSGVTNPAPVAVYQSERWGAPNLVYTLAGITATNDPIFTPGVTYLVRLHFAEIYFSNRGERRFNVSINNRQVLTDFDIVAEAGGANKAIVREFTATAASVRGSNIGSITINFTQGAANNPKVSAIEILPATIFVNQRPALPDASDNRSYELGTRFSTSVDGQVRAIRYWKSPSDTGVHTGRIWSSTGTLLTSVVFTNETASGWQEMPLPTPLAISRTTFYTVSVNANTNYPITYDELVSPGVFNGYLRAGTFGGVSGGVFGDSGTYPLNTFRNSNYYRDVVFTENASSPPVAPPPPPVNTQTVFSTQLPALTDASDNRSYELGMKFTANANGEIGAIRYFKATSETGAHTGRIWAANGTLLASVTFTNETASGWQEAALSTPLAITANSVYTVSVNANTNYAFTLSGLATSITSGNLSTVADNNNGVFGDIGTFPTASFSNSNYWRDVRFTPTSTPVAAEPFRHRGYLGWIRDLSSTPRPNDEWPSILIDDGLINDYRDNFALMNQIGLNEASIWGFFAARDWSVDVENTIDPQRAAQIRALMLEARSRNVKVLVGMGAYSWGFDSIIRANPAIACPNNPHVMNPTLEESWYWQKRVIDYVMTFPVDGVSLQSADQGRCDCPTCPGNDLDYHARINDRIASYIKTNYPGKTVGINGYGMYFGNPADLPYVINMTRHADYLIDVQDTARQSDPTYRRRLIAAIAPAAFGGITTPNVEPPQHWDRERWFLPINKRMALNLQELYNDGGRAAENFMRAAANPGDEVAIRLAAAIELNPTADWRQQLDGILADVYQPQDQTARQQLLNLFLQAEDAYFDNASGYGPASIVELEPLIGASPGPPIYLTQHMNASQLANYRSAMLGLRTQAQALVSRVGNQSRMQSVVRSIDGVLTEIDGIRQ